MAGHIWDDPDKAVDGTEKVAAQTATGDFGILISSIATYFAGAAKTLTNKTIDAASNAISNLTTAMFAANVIDTDVALTANSDTRIATQKAVKAYADARIAAQDAMVFKGVTDCSGNPNYPAADRGHTYRVSVAGKIGGASGVVVEVGDMFICLTDGTASGNQATVGAQWSIIQANIDGAVTGPASSTSGNVPSFNGTSGKVLQDSGLPISALIGAWTSYSPAVTAGSGSFTSASATGVYKQIGKSVFFTVTITITTNGSAATNVTVANPVNSNGSNAGAFGREVGVSGKMLQGVINTSNMNIYNYDNTYPGATGAFIVMSGFYAAP
ncbi:hypothetical protein J4G43_030175 [Bradyrhizobium barranii subsp. barranii]|uniref:Uncharacterized protein n=1 Tax=Bradyrhizobium barranii subsp. barranii TaxID=2823807 RepID=A0A939MCN9_9BRAD|nr:hypothetical protein [Bradyrhizobium barranii]UEM09007.1 hypothetical protein J4G43_030175 [Bradyrhizobium barranii subsp. barranii]